MISYWEVVEPLFSRIDLGSGPDAFASSIASVPRTSVILFSAHLCLAEIHNGGILQLFWNNTGVLVPEGIEGFTCMGMLRAAAVLSEAAHSLGLPYPRERDDRWDAMLTASGFDQSNLERIFKKHEELDGSKGFYTAFIEITEPLGFDAFDKEFLENAKSENGGFQEAATRFAHSPHLIQ